MKSYEDETKINLVNFSYFSDEVLMDKIRLANEFGFLRGATPDEIKWVLDQLSHLVLLMICPNSSAS
jgi:hypothetical protein